MVEAGIILFSVGSGRSLVSGRLLHILLKVCPAYKDKVEIKCMGSVGGKTPTEPKLCSFYSILGHIEQDKVSGVLFYDKGDKIRR
jgi:hypothetical protein